MKKQQTGHGPGTARRYKNDGIFKLYAVSVTYATCDLTNLAVLRGFPTLVAVVDLAWGATIGAAVATIGDRAAGWLGVA